MKLPEKIKEDYTTGRISVHEYNSKIFRFNKRADEVESKQKAKEQEKMLRKRRAERSKYETMRIDQYIKDLEKQVEGLKFERRTIMADVVQLVYEENIKKYGRLTCYLCNEPVKFGKDAIDHISPVSRGGSNNFSNLSVTHARCNLMKSNKTLEEYENYRNKGK